MIFPDAQPTPITITNNINIIAAIIVMLIRNGITLDTMASMNPPNLLVVNLDSFAFNAQELE